jgi:cytochrome P450
MHVAPCIYLAHRRADVAGPDPLAFRPARWLGPDPPTGTLPFGGGVRRCLGAAFATMELEEVLRTALAQVRLGPERPGRGERMRRRSVTLTPERGGRVVLLSPGRDR